MILRLIMRLGAARFFVGYVILIALIAVQAPAQAAERERVQAFLEITGFDVALDSIALSAQNAPMMLGKEAGDFGADWSRVAEQVFDRDVMRGIALDILEQTLSEEALTHAAEFYATPLGQRLVKVENASHLSKDATAREEIGRASINQWVSEGSKRIGYLQRMSRAIDMDDTGVKAVQEIQLRFLMAASNAGVLENEIDEGTLRAVMAQNEAELRIRLKESGLISAAYTYRDIPDDDLAAYAEALEQPLMQEVYELLNAVQYEITAGRFEILAGKMAQMHPGQEL
ncbi:FIG115103: hypothetical protein [hydrothermal vent metagenome]|uniref:DUF2059 domain-containing protein n=1 Tax=hydrothermal vent metagenome TaxID=652676 RepID=A0A3B0RGV3_9ZZZZ